MTPIMPEYSYVCMESPQVLFDDKELITYLVDSDDKIIIFKVSVFFGKFWPG